MCENRGKTHEIKWKTLANEMHTRKEAIEGKKVRNRGFKLILCIDTHTQINVLNNVFAQDIGENV